MEDELWLALGIIILFIAIILFVLAIAKKWDFLKQIWEFISNLKFPFGPKIS
ncbi:MAG: hypothetical protein QXS69_01405 [Candidatus Aenigmatarchaeota archaeon]